MQTSPALFHAWSSTPRLLKSSITMAAVVPWLVSHWVLPSTFSAVMTV